MTTPQKQPLGRGLASLLPGAVAADASAAMSAGSVSKDRHPGITVAQLDEIVPNPYQPRREFGAEEMAELVESIKEIGLVQPLIVRRSSLGKGYELIAGERRLRACKEAGLKTVPIVIKKATDRDSLELALVENIQRQDLNCLETALAYQRLVDEFSYSHEEIAKRVGKDRTSVVNHIRILRLPLAVQEFVRAGKVSFGHAKVILGLDSEGLQVALATAIVNSRLSVRESEEWILAQAGEKTPEVEVVVDAKPEKQRLVEIGEDLTRIWSTKVVVKGNAKKGKFVISYHTSEELERILTPLMQGPTRVKEFG